MHMNAENLVAYFKCKKFIKIKYKSLSTSWLPLTKNPAELIFLLRVDQQERSLEQFSEQRIPT